MWHNLAEHASKAVARHHSCLRQIAAAAQQAQPPPEPALPAAADPAESRLAARMRDQHATVQALAARGLGLRAIARELGIDRKTARRFAYAATGDEAVARAISRPTVLDRYQPHLHRRWNEGCHDVAVLHAEITALGYRGSRRTLYRYLQPLRTGTAPPPAAVPPRIGEVTSWLLRRPEDLSPRQQQLLTGLRAHCAQLDRLAEHVTSFAKMMTKRTGTKELAGWLERAEADDQPELHTFAAGIRLDLAAVTAGLSLPYSSGATEGNVNRLKASNGRCMAAPASTSCANASSITPGNHDHRICARAHRAGQRQTRSVACLHDLIFGAPNGDSCTVEASSDSQSVTSLAASGHLVMSASGRSR